MNSGKDKIIRNEISGIRVLRVFKDSEYCLVTPVSVKLWATKVGLYCYNCSEADVARRYPKLAECCPRTRTVLPRRTNASRNFLRSLLKFSVKKKRSIDKKYPFTILFYILIMRENILGIRIIII